MAKTPTNTQQSYTPDAERFRNARNRLGMSMPAFAEACGVSKGTIQNIENGEKITGKILTAIFEKVATTHVGKELGCTHWHDLLHEDKRKELGSPLPPRPPVIPTPTFANRLFQLPAALADFVGREEQFEAIVARLAGRGGKVGLSALRGMGGVGKTSLAVQVAHAVKEHYPDTQLFLELRGVSDSPVTPVEAMSRIIRDLLPESDNLPDTVDELLPTYRSVLAGKRALILLDNAKDAAQVEPLLTAGPPVAFLLTSRKTLGLSGVESVRLDVLTPDDAFTLLRDIVKAKGTDDELREVANLCDYLPLALRVAGDFLRLHANWKLPQYIAALRNEITRPERLKRHTDDRGVGVVLALSAVELVNENAERAARWQMLSVFPADFDAKAAAAVWELDADATLDELTALLDRSLLQHDADTDRYDLHDLMRPVAGDAFECVDNHPLQTTARVRLRTAELRFAQHHCAVLTAAKKEYKRGTDGVLAGLALFDLEVSNIRHGWGWACHNRTSDFLAMQLCRDYPDAGGDIIILRLSARERVIWLGYSVEACRELKDRPEEGNALRNLGRAHRHLGDVRTAISFFKESLAIAHEVKDRRGEAKSLRSCGQGRGSLGVLGYRNRTMMAAR